MIDTFPCNYTFFRNSNYLLYSSVKSIKGVVIWKCIDHQNFKSSLKEHFTCQLSSREELTRFKRKLLLWYYFIYHTISYYILIGGTSRSYGVVNLACTPDLGQVVLTVPSPLKREDSFLLGVGGRSTLGTAGSWSRHSQPHCSGSTVSGCSSRCRMFFLHLLAGMHVCRLGTPSL